MRIIAVSDLHGSWERMELLLELTQADIYIFTGDLLYNPFRSLADLENFYSVQMQLRQLRGTSKIALPLWLRRHQSSFSPEQKELTEQYFGLVQKAEQSMQAKYRALERMAEIKPRTKLLFIPGNYDMDLRATALASMQIHKASQEFEGVRIAGYGGAPVFTSGIPETLAVKFHESKNQGPGSYSEPLDSLLHLDPDIAAVHTPPLGVLDGSPGRGFGSWGIREFIEQSPRCKVLLCGHVHNGWGVAKVDNTWVINSGNFGQVVEGTGYRRGGYFSEFMIGEDGKPQWATLKRLERSKIWHILEYSEDADGRLIEQVIEPKRAAERREHGTVATKLEAEGRLDEKNLALLENYNQVKLFLRRFETAASERRVDDVREMVRLAAEQGTEIAFDILGSVNMGQSVDESDVDAILYIEDDPANNRYSPTFWTQLVEQVVQGRYELEFTDIIDLWEVRKAVEEDDLENEALQRFVIYRTIGRPVNVRLLRRYDDLIIGRKNMKRKIQAMLASDLEAMAGTYSQVQSFEKYMRRLHEKGVRIPPRIQARVHRYLHTLADDN